MTERDSAEEGEVTIDWPATAAAYAERIHVLERIARADQQSYRELQVENENLKFRLSMAESNNPDSVLSKHNAMLMACESRDRLKAELETVKDELATVQGFYEVECQRTVEAVERMIAAERSESALQAKVADLESERDTDLAMCKAQRDDNENAWSCEKQKRIAAESERDTARADVQALADHWQAEIEQHAALQAKVARAVALWDASLKARGAQYQIAESEFYEALEALR